MKVLFTIGLPASGKSTWSKNFCEKNIDWVRVNRDDLRLMRGKYWLPDQERLISMWELDCILSGLSMGKHVIVDATNLNTIRLDTLKREIKFLYPKIEFETKVFNISVELCIKRDKLRINSVGEKVIRQMYNDYLKPPINKVKIDLKLPYAIICDLDGTLAIHNGRSPYEELKCDTDLVNTTVRDILWNTVNGTKDLIFMSGRTEAVREKTELWLKNVVNISRSYNLYMRQIGDHRKDYIVKKELFDTYIRDKYNISFVLDDRLQVCRMWHELGLTVLRIGDPDADF